MHRWHDGVDKKLREVNREPLLVGCALRVPVEGCLDLIVAAPDGQAGMMTNAARLLSDLSPHLSEKRGSHEIQADQHLCV